MALRCELIWLLALLLASPVEAKRARTKRKQRGARLVTLAMARVKRPPVERSGKPGRSRARQRRVKRDLWPPMSLVNANTRERLTVRLYDRRGRTIGSSVKKLRHFLRCHHTGRVGPIHWRLLQRIYVVARHYKGKTLRVFSGYRSRKVAYLKTSKHTLGRAVDFAVDGVSTRALRDYLRTTFTKSRGLGFYPNTPFVHFDVREKTAFWVDYSGKGEEPRYAQNPYDVLRQEHLARTGKSKPTPPAEVFGPPAPPVAVATGTEEVPGPPAPPAGPNVPPPGDGDATVSTSEAKGPPARPAPAAPVDGPQPVGPAPVAKEPTPPVSNVRSAPP